MAPNTICTDCLSVSVRQQTETLTCRSFRTNFAKQLLTFRLPLNREVWLRPWQ